MSAPYTPAFPYATVDHRGMSLRDYFAAKAMQGLLANPDIEELTHEQVAYSAYATADALLHARTL